jgi:hypothetical protein
MPEREKPLAGSNEIDFGPDNQSTYSGDISAIRFLPGISSAEDFFDARFDKFWDNVEALRSADDRNKTETEGKTA